MKLNILFAAILVAALPLLATEDKSAVDSSEPHQPHTPTLIFYLTGADGQKDVDAIQGLVQKLQGAKAIEVSTNRSYARIRFDSHVVSYHQVAQAVVDAGKSLGKNYDPFLVFFVSEYALTNNAKKVDAVFAGKRLNTRVKVTALDKLKGTFAVHFLPLEPATGPATLPGFNGGHLHHPISDPPPRGLGLTSGYASEFDPAIHPD